MLNQIFITYEHSRTKGLKYKWKDFYNWTKNRQRSKTDEYLQQFDLSSVFLVILLRRDPVRPLKKNRKAYATPSNTQQCLPGRQAVADYENRTGRSSNVYRYSSNLLGDH